MTRFLSVLFVVLSVSVKASDNFEYNSDTVKKITSILWLTENQDSAIVYGTWEGFIQLRETIDAAIMTSQTATIANEDISQAERLLMLMPDDEKMLEIFLLEDAIIYDGLRYPVKTTTVAGLKRLNQKRIANNELISPRLLAHKLEQFELYGAE